MTSMNRGNIALPRATAFAGVAAMLLGACAQSEPAEPYRVIDTQAEFTALFVDKPTSRADAGTFVLRSDGTIGGDFNGAKPVGTWEFKDGSYCRAMMIGSRDFPYDCLVTEVSGKTARFTLGNGTVSGGWKLGA